MQLVARSFNMVDFIPTQVCSILYKYCKQSGYIYECEWVYCAAMGTIRMCLRATQF